MKHNRSIRLENGVRCQGWYIFVSTASTVCDVKCTRNQSNDNLSFMSIQISATNRFIIINYNFKFNLCLYGKMNIKTTIMLHIESH